MNVRQATKVYRRARVLPIVSFRRPLEPQLIDGDYTCGMNGVWYPDATLNRAVRALLRRQRYAVMVEIVHAVMKRQERR